MKKTINKKTLLILALSLWTLNFNAHICYSMNDQNDEDNQLIEADKIAPHDITNLEGRSYDEGITIKEIEIKGNNLVKTNDILKNLNLKVGSKFDRDLVQKDLKAIYDMGYFSERLKAVPQPSSTGIKLRIEVEENSPVTGFNVTGNKIISTADLSKIFNKQTGLPQNISELNKAVEQIESLYAEKGYILARVKKISDDPDGVINIQINEGVIDSVKITGNTKTKDFVIKRNMLTASGQVYNENVLKQDLSRIFGTQAFSDVRRVIAVSPKDPDKYQLTIEVDEKRTGSISVGGGIDTVQGLFGTLGYMDNNFIGRGQQLSTTFMIGSGAMLLSNSADVVKRSPIQIDANFVEPRLEGTLNSLQVSAYGKDLASFQVPLAIERRIGGDVELARPIKKIPHLAGSMSLGVENVNMSEGDLTDINNDFKAQHISSSQAIIDRAQELKGGTFLSLGPSLVYDTRNNIANPTNGLYANAGFNESFMLTGNSGTFGKVTADVRKFYPVGKKSTFTVDAKVGTKVLGTMPEFATFRLGGPYTIRGFNEGDVGNGTGFMMASAEYRTPIPFLDRVTNINFINNIRLAAFLDAGSIFGGTIANTLFNKPGYAIATGLGLRVGIPGLGPIRVDCGYPLTFIGSGKTKNPVFTFGFGDK